MAIDFLTIGHITHDLTPGGFRLGGTVSFAAVTALRMGRQPAIITRGTPEGLRTGTGAEAASAFLVAQGPLYGIPVHLQPSTVNTTFTNIYHEGRRTQVIAAVAEPIVPGDLPLAWAEAPLVLLGAVARELPPAWTEHFPSAIIGVAPQGLMRQWDERGHVSPSTWEDAGPFLTRADAVLLSREDVGDDDAYIECLTRQTRLLVVTDGYHGATFYTGGESQHVPARAAKEVDPTGAGDVFAASFLIRLHETGDPLLAARFANVVASMSIEAPGMDAIPYRAQVDEWLRHNP